MEIWEKDTNQVAFFQKSTESFKMNGSTGKVLRMLDAGISHKEIMQEIGISSKDLEKITKVYQCASSKKIPVEDRTDGQPTYLKRLSINISNTCNMKCKYCYANFGAYGSEKSLMNMDLLKITLDKFYAAFDEIAVLQVFGGEPFLNFKGFQYICEYVENRYNSGKIKYRTLITTVTNGTVVTQRVIDLINKYHIYVTVSLDGPQEVQDENRDFLNDRGTFNQVIKNIARLKKTTGQPKQIEATYNQAHVKNHISILDLIQYVNKRFDDIALHIAPVSANRDECFALDNRDMFVDSVDDIFDYNRKNKDSANYLILDSMIRALQFPERRKTFCDAGISLFSVSYTGYVYPCYMFIDQPGFALMQVQDESFSRDKLIELTKPYRDYDRQENSQCAKCPIVNVCDGCLGINYFTTGDIYKSTSEECDMKKKMVKNILFNITQAY
jgi:uncharacterized protein